MVRFKTSRVLMITIGLVGIVGVACSSVASPSNSGDTAAPAPTLRSIPVETPIASPRSTDESDVEASVQPDPNYEEELRRARLPASTWKTDFSRHTIPFGEITPVLPRDGIPAIDSPKFVTFEEAIVWLGNQEPVISLELDGDAKAYPLQILTWHEIVNDEVAGIPVTVTFCPLCNSAIAFDRRLDGVVYDFGVSGNLRNSDLIMYDRQTQTWWQQFTGDGIVGELAGRNLTILASSIISFEDFRNAFPEGKVLSRETGFRRSYGQNPYPGYDRADNPPFLFDGETDGRLQAKERIVAVTVGDVDVAFPLSVLEEDGVINYAVNGQDVAVFFKEGTASALDRSSIASSRDVGATGVFDPNVDGQKLTFRTDGDRIIDNETGSVWNILGQAIEGSLSGTELTSIVHADHFWFAWAAFKPDTIIFQSMG
jgi:hypothetical protein